MNPWAERSENSRDIERLIEDTNLGPAAVGHNHCYRTDGSPVDVMQVELDNSSWRKTHAMSCWLDLIDVRNTVAGRHRKGDPWVNLVVQGLFPNGSPVVVTAKYHDPEQVRLIDSYIGKTTPDDLVKRLLAVETASEAPKETT